jgi:hypothetical protein
VSGSEGEEEDEHRADPSAHPAPAIPSELPPAILPTILQNSRLSSGCEKEIILLSVSYIRKDSFLRRFILS